HHDPHAQADPRGDPEADRRRPPRPARDRLARSRSVDLVPARKRQPPRAQSQPDPGARGARRQDRAFQTALAAARARITGRVDRPARCGRAGLAQRRPTIKSMRFSVLDQSPISEGSTGAEALRNTIDLAQLADSLGYHRYWVAEHHGGPMLASASPEALIGPIAAATSEIRVGSGGVMLPHYSPLKVAETFTILAGLFPGRIDLGLGRAAGTDPMTTYALQRDRRQAVPDDFPQQLAELLAYFGDSLPDDHPF